MICDILLKMMCDNISCQKVFVVEGSSALSSSKTNRPIESKHRWYFLGSWADEMMKLMKLIHLQRLSGNREVDGKGLSEYALRDTRDRISPE